MIFGNARLAAFAVAVLVSLGGCATPPYLAARIGGADDVTMPASVVHEVGTFEGIGGITLFEQSWRPRGPAKATLVIVHGLKDHSSRYAGAAIPLAERGYAVHAMDLRGHGRSEGERVYVDSFDDYLADLDIFMARVQKREPGQKIFLFGHSMGGAIVTLFTMTRKPPIAGLLLSGPALKVGSEVSAPVAAITRFLGEQCPEAGVFALDAQAFSRDPAILKDNQEDPLVYQPDGSAAVAAGVLGAIGRIQANMEDVTVPLLIMHGEADRVTDPDGSRDLNRRARSTDRTLHMYGGLYHDLLHEPEHDRVFADLTHWLDAHSDGPIPRGAH